MALRENGLRDRFVLAEVFGACGVLLLLPSFNTLLSEYSVWRQLRGDSFVILVMRLYVVCVSSKKGLV